MSISEKEKLRILIPHWIEHNHSHEAEFIKWKMIAGENGMGDVARLINDAIESMKKAGDALAEALEKVGGPASGEAHHHHHHHH